MDHHKGPNARALEDIVNNQFYNLAPKSPSKYTLDTILNKKNYTPLIANLN